MSLTYAQLIEWIGDRTVNPLSKRRISYGKSVYNSLEFQEKEMLKASSLKNATKEEIKKLYELGAIKRRISEPILIPEDEDSYSDNDDIEDYFQELERRNKKRNKREEELREFYLDADKKYQDERSHRQKHKILWEEFLRSHSKQYARDWKKDDVKNTKNEPQTVLKKYNISNRKDWRKWLLKNHPDKSADSNATTNTKEVLIAGKDMGW